MTAMDDPRYDALLLDNQLCFPLYACAREIVKRYKPHLDPLGLTYTQYIAMMVLWESKQITSKALGDRLLLDSGTLTPVLKKLEEKGFITRSRDPQDERNLRVTLTPEGESLRERAAEIPPNMARGFPLSPEDARTLYTLLHRFLDACREG